MAGVYMVHLCTYYNGTSTAVLRVHIQKNGKQFMAQTPQVLMAHSM